MDKRLRSALDAEHVTLAAEGRIALWGPSSNVDPSCFDPSRCLVIQGFKPDALYWEALGFEVVPEAPSDLEFVQSIVFLPRAREAMRDRVARAAGASRGALLVDGLKEEGVHSLFKALKPLGDVAPAFSKSHGKCFAAQITQMPLDWLADISTNGDGFVTYPGVFSAAKVDKGSRLLAQSLPKDLKGAWADLGAGWGYLSDALLTRGASDVALFEADFMALRCAEQNLSDKPASFYWADVARLEGPARYDGVIANPPFHTSRKSDPSLGIAFLEAAARVLTPQGQFWMVANRHLPYEAHLERLFAQWECVREQDGFKIISASGPGQVRKPRTLRPRKR